MSDHQTPPHGPSLDLGDIYYTLFRHKWRILLCSLTGLAVAFALYKSSPPPYQSDAKLFIRYVVTENENVVPGKDDAIMKSPDVRGETIMNSEAETLTSLDLAETVARQIGPEKILARLGGGKNSMDAAVVIRKGLEVEVMPHSSVIQISFAHPDPEIAQPVLRSLIDAYLKKHVEIHRSVGLVGDFLTQETDQLRAKLAQTEEELRKVRNQAGIISLEDSKKAFAEQMTKINSDIFSAQAELAERTSVLQEMIKRVPSLKAPSAEGTTPAPAPPPPEKLRDYQSLVARLDGLRKREQELLAYFSEQSVRVQEVRAQLAEAEQQKQKLETDFPALAQQGVTASTPASPRRSGLEMDPIAEADRITALQAKLKVLNSQLDQVKAQASRVDELEISILELRRRKELQETNYRYYAAALEQSRIKEALGTGQVSNISQVQSPSPAYRDWTKKLKLLGGIAVGGIALGIAWAFLIELYFDRSVRRPADIERSLGFPLFLSIPQIGTNGNSKRLALLPPAASTPPPRGGTEGEGGPLSPSPSPSLSLSPSAALSPFHETLRDRLISYFDSLNLRHKPKLVAVTGVGKNTGVTTIAAGLAKSFSETGEGNVLLVDMTQGQGSAQHFHKGNQIGLDQFLETKDSAQVNDNLYVVTEDSGSERLAKGMPQRFNQLVPKLKASDFDYIIFDMPPVNQISITPRLASFMDMMLMVVESEKTNRDIALHASALLAKSKTPVGVVLNKTKSYIPPRLHQDREFLLGM
jgi:succinoglycan biosynthesis transport protein ExoP